MDLLLLMAASENDAPKVAELLRAGADLSAKVEALASSLQAEGQLFVIEC